MQLQILGGHRPSDAEDADPLHVAKVVLDLFERWRGFEHALHAVVFNGHIQRFAGARTDDALHVAKAVDCVPIYRNHEVAGLKAGSSRRAAGLYGIDPGAHGLFAVQREHAGKNDDSQDEIRRRSRNDNGDAFQHRLEHESPRALVSIQIPRRLARDAGDILVAKELYETAKRDGRDFPAGPVTVVKANDFGAEADRKNQNLHAAPACNQKVSELMEEDDQAEDKKKRNNVAKDAAAKHVQMRQNVRPHDVTSPSTP